MRHLILSVALCATSAQAEFKDGNNLLSDMNGSQMRQMSAIGYVIGVIDALNGVTVCPPVSVTAGQVHDIVKMHLENNPQLRHHAGDFLVHQAISRVWPCQRRGGGA